MKSIKKEINIYKSLDYNRIAYGKEHPLYKDLINPVLSILQEIENNQEDELKKIMVFASFNLFGK